MNREMKYLTTEELEQTMKKTGVYADYIRMDKTWKKRFEDYMTGKKTMPLTMIRFSNVFSIQMYTRNGCRICSVQLSVNLLQWRMCCRPRIRRYRLIHYWSWILLSG